MKSRKWFAVLSTVIFLFGIVACEDEKTDETKNKNLPGVKVSGNIIDLSGGDGSLTGDASGGDGGEISSYWFGSRGISFAKSGRIDTKFNVPTYTNAVDLGANGWVVADDTLLDTYLLPTEPVDGEYHLHTLDETIYARVLGADIAVTGLHVNRNVTLTINANYSVGGTICLDQSSIVLLSDVEIIGTVEASDLTAGIDCGANPEIGAVALDKQYLQIESERFYLRGYGLIDNSGDDGVAAGDRGGNGGTVSIVAFSGLYIEGDIDASGGDGNGTGNGGNGAISLNGMNNISIESMGGITNTGNLNASGGQGQSGGNAGEIHLGARSSIWSVGDLLANGGTGSAAGPGGDAESVELHSMFSSVFHRGSLESIGGDGGLGGGDGENVYLRATRGGRDIGRLIGSGVVDVSGGNATAYGDGGSAGYIYAYSYGSYIHTTTKFIGNGGNAYAASGYGGDAASLIFYVNNNVGSKYGGEIQTEGIVIANDIIAKGGNGYIGGNGGHLDVNDGYEYTYYYYPPFAAPKKGRPGTPIDAEASFIGFDVIKMNGGDGVYGGDGGYVELSGVGYSIPIVRTTVKIPLPFNLTNLVGPIILNVPLQLNGGDGLYGGEGGLLAITMQNDNDGENSVVLVNASIDINGGNGGYYGGNGYGFYILGADEVQINARIDTNGGDGGYYGGNAYFQYIFSNGNIINNSVLSASGGYGEIYGGYGGIAYLIAGKTVINNGVIGANGGDSDLNGGFGGLIFTLSQYGKTKNNGNISVVGGQATLPDDDGMNGFIYLDMNNVTPIDGTL